MLNNSYAIYNGIKYEATSNGEDIVLIKHEAEEGFEPSKVRENYYKKTVRRNEVSEYFTLRKNTTYKGVDVAIVEEKGDELLLFGSNHRLPDLGFDTISRGEYRKWVNRRNVEYIKEEKYSYLD